MFAKFIAAEAQDLTCRQYVTTIGHSESMFNIDGNGLLVGQSTIDDAIETFVPKLFQAGLLYATHHRSLAGNPRITQDV